MTEITRAPLISCDCCGTTAEMRRPSHAGEKPGWLKPDAWGSVRVSPTTFGNYPNHITMQDLCPDCTLAIHEAVTKAIEERKASAEVLRKALGQGED